MEKIHRVTPEQNVPPFTLDLNTREKQEAMLSIAYTALMNLTGLEVRGVDVSEKTKILRPVLGTLAGNLGIKMQRSELVLLGITDDLTVDQLRRLAEPEGPNDVVAEYAGYFVEKKKEAMNKE